MFTVPGPSQHVCMCCQRPPALYLFQAHPLFSQQPPPPEERFEPLPLLPQPAVKLYIHIASISYHLAKHSNLDNILGICNNI